MRNFILISAGLIVAVGAAGCVNVKQDEVQNSSEPEILMLKRENVKLSNKNKDYERENLVLKDKVATLTSRERALSKKIAEMQFELKQRNQQVEALADLPAERDRLKKEVESLKSQVVKLQLRLENAKTGTSE